MSFRSPPACKCCICCHMYAVVLRLLLLLPRGVTVCPVGRPCHVSTIPVVNSVEGQKPPWVRVRVDEGAGMAA